jgi:integrase
MATGTLHDDGARTELVSRRLGHSSTEITSDLYMRHRVEEPERALAEGIAARIRSAQYPFIARRLNS